MESVA
jgi:hypothetical protein